MRKLPSFALLATLTAGLYAQDPVKPDAKGTAPAVDKTAAKTLALGMRANGGLTLKDIDGNEVKAKSLQGKITVVNFYSIQCPIQAAWDKRLAAVQKEFAPKDVVFLNINSNRTEIGDTAPTPKEGEKAYGDIRSHLQDKDLPYRVLVDHGNVVADAFGAKTTPDLFVFGKDGKLVYRGLIDDDQRGDRGEKATRYLHDVVSQLVAGEKVEAFETKPAGCTIKRMPKAKMEATGASAGKGDGEGAKTKGK